MPHIDVLYYDKTEEELFENGPHSASIAKVVESGIETQLADLLDASMFMEQKDAPGWLSRKDLRKRAASRFVEFAEYFGIGAQGRQDTVGAIFEPMETPASQIERIGVGLSLVTMDAIFETHGADWEKIPVTGQKDLDFRVASLGRSFVAVEAKGSLVKDVNKKEGLSEKKASIKGKKKTQEDLGSKDFLVGAIAAVPSIQSDQACRVWLVDPPLERPLESPKRFKLLARMRSYQRILYLIGEPHLLLALSNRIRALEAIESVEKLDGVALTSATGRNLGVPPSAGSMWSGSPGRHTGVVSLVGAKLVYIGIALEVLELIAAQEHERITSWKYSARADHPEQMKVRKRDVVSSRGVRLEQDSGDRFDSEFVVSESTSGLVVGLAPIPPELAMK